ncbi:MAG: DUF4878 domain-containing protein [Rikenellaceae bacterium]
MKKLFTLLTCVCAFAFMVSCSSSSSPSTVAIKQIKAMQSEDYKAFGDLLYIKGDAEAAEKKREQYVKMVTEMTESQKKRNKYDPIASYEVLSETISEDGTKATVELAVVSKAGKESKMETDLISIDGKWYIDSRK